MFGVIKHLSGWKRDFSYKMLYIYKHPSLKKVPRTTLCIVLHLTPIFCNGSVRAAPHQMIAHQLC